MYVLARVVLRVAAPAPVGAAPKASACDKLAPFGAAAVIACKVGGAVLGDVFSGRESGDEVNKHNIPLNGAIVSTYPVDPRFHTTGQGYVVRDTPGVGAGYTIIPALKGKEIPVYKNGCVPLTGDPRFAKCVEGTKKYNHFAEPGTSTAYNAATGHGDTLTHRHYGSGFSDRYKPKFPIPCAAPNESWWLSGQPACCPPGSLIARRTNADGSRTSVCVAPSKGVKASDGSYLPPPPKSASDGQGGATVSDAGDGHHIPPPRPTR